MLWFNLVKVDQHKQRAKPDVEEAVSAIGLLPAELEITQPDAVVFFTGPRYDGRMRKTFPEIEFSGITPLIARVLHPALPYSSFRTYHPKFLWLKGQKGVVDSLASLILRDQAGPLS